MSNKIVKDFELDLNGEQIESLRRRFWKFVIIREDDECWEWLGNLDRRGGYGRIRCGRHKLYAHRISYLLTYGAFPAGCVITHRCDNPSCVNPLHLYADSQRANIMDAIEKGRFHQERDEKGRYTFK